MLGENLADIKHIESHRITFVIQGETIETQSISTSALISSIRNFFPNSTIILSTWKTYLPDVAMLADQIILNETPEQFFLFRDDHTKLNNVNLMIVSSLNGIRASKTEYTVRLRSDLLLNSAALDKMLFIASKLKSSKESLFSQPIIVCDVTTINACKSLPLINHPCDWISAGLTTDLLRFWDVPLMANSDANFFSTGREIPTQLWGDEAQYVARFRSEAYVWTMCLARNDPQYVIPLDGFGVSRSDKELSNTHLIKNFIVLPCKRIGLGSQKHKISSFRSAKVLTLIEMNSLRRLNGLDRACFPSGSDLALEIFGKILITAAWIVPLIERIYPILLDWRKIIFRFRKLNK